MKVYIFESASNVFGKVIYILPRLKKELRARRQTAKCKEEAKNHGRGGACSCDIVLCIHSLTYDTLQPEIYGQLSPLLENF